MASKAEVDAVLNVGTVEEVNGRLIYISVDRHKNLSDVFLDGDVVRNISVNSFIEIRKGFLRIIGRVEGEKIIEERPARPVPERKLPAIKRLLTVSLVGVIDTDGVFTGGTKEMPLIGNPAYLLSSEKIQKIQRLTDADLALSFATSFGDEIEIPFPVDGLFNSHIAIFGNTGSGKSHTLAAIYREFFRVMEARNPAAFHTNCRFVLFDFNGEYTQEDCLSPNKTVYNLSTRAVDDRIPMHEGGFLNVETLSIIADATEKTQQPFIKRTLRLHNRVTGAGNPVLYLREIVRNHIRGIFQLSDRSRALAAINQLRELLPYEDPDGNPVDITADIEFFNGSEQFRFIAVPRNPNSYLRENPDSVSDTLIFKQVDHIELQEDAILSFIQLMHIQLVGDLVTNRAQYEHVAPVINRLSAKQPDIAKVFNYDAEHDVFDNHNLVVVNLNDVNLEMKKTIPLLLSKKLYSDHKQQNEQKSLSLIIDEAHNILSTVSSRESESWKDYRLETFEEIVKEGRKFGVFITISSQRPSDISPTITSQAHNYFIHRLINQQDLRSIATAVSYIDKVTEDSIPTLPTGTCVFSGTASQMPLKINVNPLEETQSPRATTLKFSDIVPIQKAE